MYWNHIIDASAWGLELGARQATVNCLEGFLFRDGEDGPTVPIEIRVVDKGGIEGLRFRVDRLCGGEDQVGHQVFGKVKLRHI